MKQGDLIKVSSTKLMNALLSNNIDAIKEWIRYHLVAFPPLVYEYAELIYGHVKCE